MFRKTLVTSDPLFSACTSATGRQPHDIRVSNRFPRQMAVKAEVWVEAATEGGRRFMAAWRQEEEDAARHRQEKREATRLRKLQSDTEA